MHSLRYVVGNPVHVHDGDVCGRRFEEMSRVISNCTNADGLLPVRTLLDRLYLAGISHGRGGQKGVGSKASLSFSSQC